jgi:hypothetical protein
MPPVFRYLPLSHLRPGARALLRERESGEVSAAEMPAGLGRCVLLGLDETWRWRFKSGGQAHARAWATLIRGECEPPYAASGSRISLDVARAAVSSGEPAGLRVKVLNEDGAPSQPATVDVRVMRGGDVIRTQSLTGVGPGRYAGTLLGLPVGDYRIEARAANDAIGYPLHVVGQYESELEDPSGDPQALRRIVEASGGQALTLDQMRQLPGTLAELTRRPNLVTVPLWSSSYLFVFVVACFALEWAVRKRMGLA